jgi:hypothetical protein
MTDDRHPKPCPVCKTRATVVGEHRSPKGQFVECHDRSCRMSGPKGDTPEHAIWLWNRISFDNPLPTPEWVP